MKLDPKHSVALVIDLQEKLVPVMSNSSRLISRTDLFLKGLHVFDVPVIVTRQYPKGLGDTISPIRETLNASNFNIRPASVFDKTSFSCLDEPAIRSALDLPEYSDIFVLGIESHICVLQTVLDLLETGKQIHFVSDCIDSRSPEEKDIAEKRMIQSGVFPTTCETILFQLTRHAGSESFKKISKLVTGR